ncbi:MAG: AAA family ATPase [Lachnospiraceae bacterium]|nr:AAA family ATPase [Lachnospiraceae bacterium]
MRRFNITGTCYPDEHYMVDISARLERISKMVDDGEYITINRGRQYGKTTTLSLLKDYLGEKGYPVFSISFESLTDEQYESAPKLFAAFWSLLDEAAEYGLAQNVSQEAYDHIRNSMLSYREELPDNITLGRDIAKLCTLLNNRVVVLIDEVDQAGNHNSFIRFLAMLRDKYLKRRNIPTFRSVILAGVYDIKNLKLKIRPEEEHQYNSPWNIALPFTDDMAFSAKDIEGMLSDYEADHASGMDVAAVAQLISDYTSGYPFLVSKLCKTIDETPLGWNREGVLSSVRELLNERNTLFDDMAKKLDDFSDLRAMLKAILYNGSVFTWNTDNKVMELAYMFGYIREIDRRVVISNRIMELRLYNAFLSEEETNSQLYASASVEKPRFIKDGALDMDLILERFVVHYTDIYGDRDEAFHEEEGRKHFMLYIKPIINGTGNYYIESETRDRTRTDMIIDYLGKQYIIEMKIWHGNAYNERGEEQLSDYLDFYHCNKGYMLSFNFNKNKTIGVHTIDMNGKTIVEAVV